MKKSSTFIFFVYWVVLKQVKYVFRFFVSILSQMNWRLAFCHNFCILKLKLHVAYRHCVYKCYISVLLFGRLRWGSVHIDVVLPVELILMVMLVVQRFHSKHWKWSFVRCVTDHFVLFFVFGYTSVLLPIRKGNVFVAFLLAHHLYESKFVWLRMPPHPKHWVNS